MPVPLPALVEACADSKATVLAAAASGAGRLELCEQLDVGGVTPSPALLDWTLEHTSLPVVVMIRPRGGAYTHDAPEMHAMARDAQALVARGASGIVAGVLTAAGEVDMDAMRRLAGSAGAPVTFHRAFDCCASAERAHAALMALGVARVLTSGGTGTAWEGRAAIAALVRRSAGKLTVMPGGSIQAGQARALVRATGATELHVRAERAGAVVQALATGGPAPAG